MQRIPLVELLFGLHIMGIDVCDAQGRQRIELHLGAAAHHVRHIRPLLFVRLGRARQQQRSQHPVAAIVQAHPVEARLVQGQRREEGVDLIPHHQPIVLRALPIPGDHQTVEEAFVGSLPPDLVDAAAPRQRLLLNPVVDHPAAAQTAAEGVVELLALQQPVDVAGIVPAGVAGVAGVPRLHVGFGQMAQSVPLVHRRTHLLDLEIEPVWIDRAQPPRAGIQETLLGADSKRSYQQQTK